MMQDIQSGIDPWDNNGEERPAEHRRTPISQEQPAEHRRTLRTLAEMIPEECYEKPTRRGLAYLGRDLALYGAGIALLSLPGDSPALLVAGWALSTLSIAALFVLAHDAAHGSLFKTARLNSLIGHLAMLPSLHVFSVWAYGHNRVHHAFPGCKGLDFVWHPIAADDYRRLNRASRLLHRIEWSRFGAGLYYAREIWWKRLIRMAPPPKMAERFQRDRIAVLACLALASTIAGFVGWQQYGTLAGAFWFWTKVLFVPWALWNFTIGWAVYIQHIGPDMPWHERSRWRKFAGQVETTSNLVMPSWLNFFWHNIFVHIPHHVDPRIPFYNLPAAARAISDGHRDVPKPRTYRLREYLRVTKQCKLYDFESEVWTDYRGSGEDPASP